MSKKAYDILLIILIIAAVIVAVLFAMSLFNYFSSSSPEPTPVPPIQQDPWARIQESGKIVVGTSADYPPFAFYNDAYQLDGFDVALMRAIGQQMGVQVEFRDMAFEGLNGALQLGQIDSAIAAISRTPAREQVVDFSNVYYVSSDATIANQNSSIVTISTVSEMAGYRVGVQRGTVYERWLQTSLVDTGLMPASNLHTYQLADQIVRDVREGRIDLGVLDLLPAQTAVSSGGIKIVGQGLNQELYAIAMLKGAATLQTELNNALTQLSNSGQLNALISQYLGVPPEQIVPTPTPPAITPTPLPTATAVPCINGMKFVADLNLNDNNMQNPPVIPPGQPFTKGWRIQNTGTCAWNQSYRLVFASGNNPQAQMGGQPTPIVGTVAPGQQYDIYVNFVAPIQPGTYQSFWTMSDPQNTTFGDRIWVGITVPAPATATPAATQTPNPSIAFSVSQTQINEGECVTFTWNVTGASAVYFYRQGTSWQSNPVPPSGSQSDCPSSTTTYELLVVWPNGTQEIRQITVNVRESPNAPNIAQFVITPATQIQLGQCVQINWWVDGTISSIQITRDSTVIWNDAPIAGNMQDCPQNAGQVTYGITASGPGGTSRQQQIITVTQPQPPTATPQPNTPTAVPVTPTALPPIIYSFTVQPGQIEAGQCVTGNWSIGGSANQARILRNGQVILENAPFTGSGTDCLNEAGTYVYRLEARSAQGGQTAEERTVVVSSAPVQPTNSPVPPLANTNWALQSYNDGSGAMVALIPGTQITANFTADQINGNGGCNTYNGRYTTNSSGGLTISDLAVGLVACNEPAGVMEQENSYANLLRQTARYQISGTQMTMLDANGRTLLQFESALTIQPTTN
ncbi:MAG: transporter substrate-binding domain-containing protein [Anaerolineae bacterium]|nr:transporter substrate-binding domain-containing protein [Anaerolineae bacterium]